jgi:hypothetical protein
MISLEITVSHEEAAENPANAVRKLKDKSEM